jgi:hypothetical protein
MGGPKRVGSGASYGDRRAMQARPGTSGSAPGVAALRVSQLRHSASNSERNFSMYEMYGPIAPS